MAKVPLVADSFTRIAVVALSTRVSHPFFVVRLLQVSVLNSLVLTMIGNLGSACVEDATFTEFTSGCNSTVEASQVSPLRCSRCQSLLARYLTLFLARVGGMSQRRFT